MRVLVCGSRNWADADMVSRRLDELPRGSKIIVGDARGADRHAVNWADKALAEKRCGSVTFCPANWHIHGKRAGIVRNLYMLDLEPELVIAFWDGKSRGTKHTIDEAERRSIPIEIVRSEFSSGMRAAQSKDTSE